MKTDSDVSNILYMDGIEGVFTDKTKSGVFAGNLKTFVDENSVLNSWAQCIIDSKSNSATLICQRKGEGNREHYHPYWDEWWYIISGTWDVLTDSESFTAHIGDFIFIERGKKHCITARGDSLNIRLAVSRYDVDHVYDGEKY